jgi:hypothetical protein
MQQSDRLELRDNFLDDEVEILPSLGYIIYRNRTGQYRSENRYVHPDTEKEEATLSSLQ